ncbi:MAG: aminotransferase class V-fold PLP-dependent enzyme [Candidatus Coatesbacteria bacterium]|nr:aminotransferase class V-fold PLP-dependent enzyme [Candidatus Coatesbacteria bacterium]
MQKGGPVSRYELDEIRSLVIGLERSVPLPAGAETKYINFDNAASTPALEPVRDKVDELLEWYSSIHRGTGYKSTIATEIYEEARRVVAAFVGADPATHQVVFTVNTTVALNRLACCLPRPENAAVLISPMEHHSNELPWRRCCETFYLPLDETGRIDLEAAERRIAELADRLLLVAVTGASNITGRLTPLHELARICHAHGTRIVVDAAQLGAHSPLDVEPAEPGAHLDFIVLAGHKMYAPFGGAAIIGRADALESCLPACVGGGTVKLVTRERVVWADPPELLEPGTPNVVGAVALAAAAEFLRGVGFDWIVEHERELTARLLRGMADIDGVILYGGADVDDLDDRLGVVSFNLDDYHHSLTAAALSYEGGIGVRNGCFCAHPYVIDLLGVDDDTFNTQAEAMLAGDRRRILGMVRASLGLYNSPAEVDTLLELLSRLAAEGPALEYEQDKRTGAWHPRGFRYELDGRFSFMAAKVRPASR